jgi:hypothetical protein
MKMAAEVINGKPFFVFKKEEGVYDYFDVQKTKNGNKLTLNIPDGMLCDLELVNCLDNYINKVKEELELKIRNLK